MAQQLTVVTIGVKRSMRCQKMEEVSRTTADNISPCSLQLPLELSHYRRCRTLLIAYTQKKRYPNQVAFRGLKRIRSEGLTRTRGDTIKRRRSRAINPLYPRNPAPKVSNALVFIPVRQSCEAVV